MIDIAALTDERGLKIAARATKNDHSISVTIHSRKTYEVSQRVGTADNDINAFVSMGMVPGGYSINNFLTDPDAFFLITDVPNGMKHLERAPLTTKMEGDFDTGNVRYKARERYVFGVSDPRGIFGITRCVINNFEAGHNPASFEQ